MKNITKLNVYCFFVCLPKPISEFFKTSNDVKVPIIKNVFKGSGKTENKSFYDKIRSPTEPFCWILFWDLVSDFFPSIRNQYQAHPYYIEGGFKQDNDYLKPVVIL